MSSFTLLKPWATATAVVSLLAIAPAQSQVLNRSSEGSAAIRVAQWQPTPVPSDAASLPPTARDVDGSLAVGTASPATAQTPVITKVYAHQVDEQDAVTLYVRDIPVLTFLANGDTSESSGDDIAVGLAAPDTVSPATAASETTVQTEAQAEAVPAPMERAQTVAQKLEAVYVQLQETDGAIAPSDIQLEWSEQDEKYWITAGDRPLVALDKWTVAVQPSANLTSDLIQTTNRLRRLVHNGAPLEYTGSRRLANPAVEVAAATTGVAPEAISSESVRSTQLGIASWYGGYFHGRRTASGERYNQNAMTAAHRHLPFGTRVRVVNLSNGQSTIVRINDRGPFIRGRIIDLSAAAAGEIGLRSMGIGRVRVEVLR